MQPGYAAYKPPTACPTLVASITGQPIYCGAHRETEALLDVELFVDADLDNEHNRPLLDLLGVRSKPTGPEHLLDRLRALSRASDPPLEEVDKWYRRLDQMTYTGSTEDVGIIKNAFQTERLIYASSGAWTNSAEVFQHADEESVPDAPLIRPSVRDLSLWAKIGVAPQPTLELILDWLRKLPSAKRLTPEELRRVKALLRRYSQRIWADCRHWLNLAGQWTPVDELIYALTLQPMIAWSHLHPHVKQSAADFQMLPVDVSTQPPFSALSVLAHVIENKLSESLDLRRSTPGAKFGPPKLLMACGAFNWMTTTRPNVSGIWPTNWVTRFGSQLWHWNTCLTLTVPRRPQLQAAGIAAIKIEGRQRSPVYVAQVTRVWRAALDACARDPAHYRPQPAWMNELDRVSEGTQTTLGAYARPWQ